MQKEDTLPWYRQFWPWFLIFLPATAVVAGLYTLWIAVQSQDSLVVDAGKSVMEATEETLLAERRALQLGLSADIGINLETGLIVARLDSAEEFATPSLMLLELSHPAFQDRDIGVPMANSRPDADGTATWSGHFASVPSGRWYVVLKADDWRLNGTWSGEAQLTLRPASEDGI